MEMCGAFSNWSCFFSVLKRQPEHLFRNILYLKRPLVGPLVFSLSLILIFGRGRGAVKDTPCKLHSND